MIMILAFPFTILGLIAGLFGQPAGQADCTICANFHTGKFVDSAHPEMGTVYRYATTEVHKAKGQNQQHYTILWKGDCQYQLIGNFERMAKGKPKIKLMPPDTTNVLIVSASSPTQYQYIQWKNSMPADTITGEMLRVGDVKN